MKSNFRNRLQIISYITSGEKYKVIFFSTIILALYGGLVLGIGNDNFIDSFMIPFQFEIFNILMFSIMFLNTLNTCHIFASKFDFYIIRLKSKKKYVNELLKNVLLSNVFNLLIFLLFYFMILNIFKLGNISIHIYIYNVSNIIYLIFYMARYFIILLLTTTLSALIYINFKIKYTMIFDSLFLIGFLVMVVNKTKISSFSILPWSYFGNVIYSSFLLDISYSILFVLILECIIYMAYKFTLKNNKVVIL
jgi:hypothetical protein